jgi:hypothetical protein
MLRGYYNGKSPTNYDWCYFILRCFYLPIGTIFPVYGGILMSLELLLEELQEVLEPKLINSFNLFNEISKPAGCEEAYIVGATLNYRNHLNEIGCTLLDMGETQAGHIGICFRYDRTGNEFQCVSGLDDGVIDFKIIALEQWVTNEQL